MHVSVTINDFEFLDHCGARRLEISFLFWQVEILHNTCGTGTMEDDIHKESIHSARNRETRQEILKHTVSGECVKNLATCRSHAKLLLLY